MGWDGGEISARTEMGDRGGNGIGMMEMGTGMGMKMKMGIQDRDGNKEWHEDGGEEWERGIRMGSGQG